MDSDVLRQVSARWKEYGFKDEGPLGAMIEKLSKS
jgi:hypothetical protein